MKDLIFIQIHFVKNEMIKKLASRKYNKNDFAEVIIKKITATAMFSSCLFYLAYFK